MYSPATPRKASATASLVVTPVRLKGFFMDGQWHCNCNPRLPALRLQVKKEGPNKGRLFYVCRLDPDDPQRCDFFLWETDARAREKDSLLGTNSRTGASPMAPPPSSMRGTGTGTVAATPGTGGGGGGSGASRGVFTTPAPSVSSSSTMKSAGSSPWGQGRQQQKQRLTQRKLFFPTPQTGGTAQGRGGYEAGEDRDKADLSTDEEMELDGFKDGAGALARDDSPSPSSRAGQRQQQGRPTAGATTSPVKRTFRQMESGISSFLTRGRATGGTGTQSAGTRNGFNVDDSDNDGKGDSDGFDLDLDSDMERQMAEMADQASSQLTQPQQRSSGNNFNNSNSNSQRRESRASRMEEEREPVPTTPSTTSGRSHDVFGGLPTPVTRTRNRLLIAAEREPMYGIAAEKGQGYGENYLGGDARRDGRGGGGGGAEARTTLAPARANDSFQTRGYTTTTPFTTKTITPDTTPKTITGGGGSGSGSGSSSGGRDEPPNLMSEVMSLLVARAPKDLVRDEALLVGPLREILDRHERRALGVLRGRDAACAAVKARDARITELQDHIAALENSGRMDRYVRAERGGAGRRPGDG